MILNQVAEELRQIGFTPKIVEFTNFGASNHAVLIDIDVKHGRYKDQSITIGLSFQENVYPEYPPHFVHLKSMIHSNFSRHAIHEFEGEEWSAYSLPPSDFWDSLASSQKNMKTYYLKHILRILEQL